MAGSLKEQLTNVGTGHSIVVYVSGPATQIVHPDGSSDLTLEGRSSSATTAIQPAWSRDEL